MANLASYGPDVALVVVDVQNDFALPTGRLYVRGGEQVVPVVNAQVTAALNAGGHVYYTQDWHPESTPHFDTQGGIWPVHCVAGSPGAELHDDLLVSGPVIRKGIDGQDGYSAFSVRDPVSGVPSATQLDGLLREAGISRLVVTGLAGDVCVKETALDGRGLGYEVVVPLEATRFVGLAEGDDVRAVEQMSEAGVVIA